MQLSLPGAPHLTYCTNIHPGESLDDIRRIVQGPVSRVHELAGQATTPFGVGLRLSGRAALELSIPGAAEELRALLEDKGQYCFTVNGFPHGTFHGARVKENVYRPDWLEGERGLYTERLSAALAVLLPEGCEGSLSTLPGAFRPRAKDEATQAIALALARQVAVLHRLKASTGKHVTLCLEPEPECFLETTADAVAFFRDGAFGLGAEREVSRLTGLSASASAGALRSHLGLCVDACHLAVEYEEPEELVRALSSAGIRIGKIQVTSALRVILSGEGRVDGPMLDALERFDDGTYLHQVVERGPQGLRRFLDLPDALSAARAEASAPPREWRVHCHVPVFLDEAAPFSTTQPFLKGLLGIVRGEAVTPHLEVETYTWDVLPPERRSTSVEEAIARELSWTRDILGVVGQGQ